MTLVLLVLGACSSDPEILPAIVPDEPGSDEGAQAPVHRKLVGDPDALVLHRERCELIANDEIEDPVLFDTPWPALDLEYEPCEECQPLVGWK